MDELKMANPIGWDELTAADNEKVFCKLPGKRVIYAKVRFVYFEGDRNELKQEFKHRVSANSTVVDVRSTSFIYNHLKWYVDSYVCEDSAEKYVSYYYTMLNMSYIVFELMTDDNQSVLRFNTEIKNLIMCVDYSCISRNNHVVIGDSSFNVITPSAFRISAASTDSHLIFIGENGYVLVNVASESLPLEDLVKQQILESTMGINKSDVSFVDAGFDHGVEWARYQTKLGTRVSTGTYFRQQIEGTSIVSFLFENGESHLDATKLLQISSEAGDLDG